MPPVEFERTTLMSKRQKTVRAFEHVAIAITRITAYALQMHHYFGGGRKSGDDLFGPASSDVLSKCLHTLFLHSRFFRFTSSVQHKFPVCDDIYMSYNLYPLSIALSFRTDW